jgi:PAS domain S-box-containing protein
MERASLRRLLSRQIASNLLESFAPLAPGTAFALMDSDGRVRARAGHLAEEAFSPVDEQAGQSLDGALAMPLQVAGEAIGALAARGPEATRPQIETALRALHRVLTQFLSEAVGKQSLAEETLERYREINLLYNIGETISTCLDPGAIPHKVLAEAARVIRADLGFVLLQDEFEMLAPGSSFGVERADVFLRTIRPSLIQALHEGRPSILTFDRTAQTIPAATTLCAPLKTRERTLGLVLLGRLEGPTFTAGDEKLLAALASQAAIAIENARLFDNVKQQRDAITVMKNYMDNIFASIASGVMTTDTRDLITTLNRAAERILEVKNEETIGQPYLEALPEVGAEIARMVDSVKRQDAPVIGYEINPVLPRRGPVTLRFHLSPLKDHQNRTTGVAFVAEDLTERRQLEERARLIRGTFEQYVAPQVVEQLLSDPASVRLGGTQREVTILYADARGFTAFSKRTDSEKMVELLNRHLTLAVAAVLAQEGTLDKFMGDAAMAIFNAPLFQPDHILRAVRAALAMQAALAQLHAQISPAEHLHFGVGIATGPAIVGNIGSTAIHTYTAIGDTVNLAWRLQGHARPGQILLDAAAYERAREHVVAQELGYIEVKGREPALAFDVSGLRV